MGWGRGEVIEGLIHILRSSPKVPTPRESEMSLANKVSLHSRLQGNTSHLRIDLLLFSHQRSKAVGGDRGHWGWPGRTEHCFTRSGGLSHFQGPA